MNILHVLLLVYLLKCCSFYMKHGNKNFMNLYMKIKNDQTQIHKI